MINLNSQIPENDLLNSEEVEIQKILNLFYVSDFVNPTQFI